MKKQEHILKSFLNAVAIFVYIAAVAWLLFNGQAIFGKQASFLAPLFVLLLFVISACVTGFLVLGKPAQLYLNGHKKDAFLFLSATLAWLALFVVALAVFLISIK